MQNPVKDSKIDELKPLTGAQVNAYINRVMQKLAFEPNHYLWRSSMVRALHMGSDIAIEEIERMVGAAFLSATRLNRALNSLDLENIKDEAFMSETHPDSLS